MLEVASPTAAKGTSQLYVDVTDFIRAAVNTQSRVFENNLLAWICPALRDLIIHLIAPSHLIVA